jgi:hypothetical protein
LVAANSNLKTGKDLIERLRKDLEQDRKAYFRWLAR